MLAPTLSTLAGCPFLFGRQPTLADAALYGNCTMLEEAAPDLLAQLAPSLVLYARRVEAACARRHL
ncbi:MAG: glutathione S-transferase family protein [Polyangiaceae bacterium]